MPTLTIDLPEETAEQLAAAAGRRGTSLADLVRQALEEIVAGERAARQRQRVRNQEAIDFLDELYREALDGSPPDEPHPSEFTPLSLREVKLGW